LGVDIDVGNREETLGVPKIGALAIFFSDNSPNQYTRMFTAN